MSNEYASVVKQRRQDIKRGRVLELIHDIYGDSLALFSGIVNEEGEGKMSDETIMGYAEIIATNCTTLILNLR